MTSEQDETLTPEPSTGAEEQGAATAESPIAENSAAEQGSPSAEKPDDRASLIASLTQNAQKNAEEEVEVDETDTGSEVDAAEAEIEAEVDEAAPVTGAEKTEDEKLSDEELEAAPGPNMHPKTKRRIEQLLTERREMKPHADYGAKVVSFLKEADISPQAFGHWLRFGAQVNAAGAKAPEILFREAERLAQKAGIELPSKREVVREVPAELIEEVNALIIDAIADQDITPAMAKKLREKLTAHKAATKVEPPKPVTQAPATTAAPAAPATPTQPAPDPEFARAYRTAEVAIDTREKELAAKFPQTWPKVRKQVQEAMQAYEGTHPQKWLAFFERESKAALAQAKAAVPPKPKPPSVTSSTIRPTATTPAKPAVDEINSLRAELTGRR